VQLLNKYNLPFTTDKLDNTMQMFSSTVAPWRWLRFYCRNRQKTN